MKYRQYLGILLGAIYGISYRLLCENTLFDGMDDYYNIYSISFLWVLPIVISILPILIGGEEVLSSKWKQFFFPILSVFLFFIIAMTSGVEDWICILIIAFPFLLAAGLVGLLAGYLLNKRNENGLFSLLLLPLLLGPVENQLPNSKEMFNVEQSIIIKASQEAIWDNIIEVPEISKDEYRSGLLNRLGIPRPIKSELKLIKGEEYRIGYFSEGLKLYETIIEEDSLVFVKFKIEIDKSELRDTPTDQHLLKSDYFKFVDISYRITALGNGDSKLRLNCNYSIESKMNSYANFWAKIILKDFEVRLLEVLKAKLEE
ncbi:MAG: hypothetical protein AB8H47_06285 [Bacteroidia bacterium]